MVVAEIIERLNPERRLRHFARVVKRKMSKWMLKRTKCQKYVDNLVQPEHAVVVVHPSRSRRQAS
jgi:hypothetical protein